LTEAGSLVSCTGQFFARDDVARALLARLDADYDSILAGDLRPLEEDWQQGVGMLDRDVTVETADGARHRGWLREVAFAGLALERVDGSVLRLAPEAVRHIHADA
jgi:hypothetical protein